MKFGTSVSDASSTSARRRTGVANQFLNLSILVGICCLPVLRSAGQDLTAVSDPGKLGFSSTGLDKIDAQMKASIADGNMVGCAALVAKKGQIAYSAVWGQRSKEKDLPVEKDTIWRIYSMSKPITSVAVMQLG